MRIMRTLREQFVERVEAFLAKSGVRPTDFGRGSLGDPSFMTHFRREASHDDIGPIGAPLIDAWTCEPLVSWEKHSPGSLQHTRDLLIKIQ